jgi:hypothetical protein
VGKLETKGADMTLFEGACGAVVIITGILMVHWAANHDQNNVAPIVLDPDRWACTERQITTVKPLVYRCVKYERT